MGKTYAGIGSRETPVNILGIITAFANKLAKAGFILRSGGADGADKAFEKGCDICSGKKEIYLPWKKFNENNSSLYLPYDIYQCNTKAIKLANKYHPNWDNLSLGAKKMMIRNSHQIFGLEMNSPVNFVVCWTKDGKDTGGTGQAIRMANNNNIPVYNLFHKDILNKIKNACI